MMLHFSYQDFVTFPDKSFSERKSHQVDAFRGTPGKNNFFIRTGMNEFPDNFAGFLIGIGTFITQKMDPPVYIRVILQVIFVHFFNDLQRPLSRRPIIQVYQAFSVYLFFQYREIFPDFCNVEHIRLFFTLHNAIITFR